MRGQSPQQMVVTGGLPSSEPVERLGPCPTASGASPQSGSQEPNPLEILRAGDVPSFPSVPQLVHLTSTEGISSDPNTTLLRSPQCPQHHSMTLDPPLSWDPVLGSLALPWVSPWSWGLSEQRPARPGKVQGSSQVKGPDPGFWSHPQVWDALL